MDKRTRLPFIVLLLSAMVGVVLSYFLFEESVRVSAGERSLSCQIGEGFSCQEALESQWNNVLGISLPVISLAFYACIIALCMGTFSKTQRDSIQASARFAFFTYLGAVAFSAFLAYHNFFTFEARCPFCIGLYLTNIAGLAAAIFAGVNLPDFFKKPGDGIGDIVKMGTIQVAVLVFGAGLLILNIAYASSVDSMKEKIEAKATERGQDAASELTKLRGPLYEKFDLDLLPRKGPADAPIKIIEFADLQCPACIGFRYTLKEVAETYPDKVAIYFAHYPLSAKCNEAVSVDMHPAACEAASALVCAQQQAGSDGFWPMHDDLFAYFETAMRTNRQVTTLSSDVVTRLAKERGLDGEQILACMKEPSTQQFVKAQIAMGNAVPLTSTPTWIINGYLRKGGDRFSGVQPQIEKLLQLYEAEAPAGAVPQPAVPKPAEPRPKAPEAPAPAEPAAPAAPEAPAPAEPKPEAPPTQP